MNQVNPDKPLSNLEKPSRFSVGSPTIHEQLPIHGIVELVNQRRRPWNVGIFKQDVPSRLLPVYPLMHALSILLSCECCDLLYEPSQPLTQRSVVRRFASLLDEKDFAELPTKRLTYGFSHLFDLTGQLYGRMKETVGDLGGGEESLQTLFGTVEPIGQYRQSLVGGVNGQSCPLKLTVRRGKRDHRLGGRVPQVPDHPPASNRGQVHPFVQAMAVLSVCDEVLGQR